VSLFGPWEGAFLRSKHYKSTEENSKIQRKKRKKEKKVCGKRAASGFFVFDVFCNVLNLVASQNESGSLTSVTSAPKAAFDREKKLGFKGFFIS
jgi:hypothetical protein